jgi:hypothetical protein
MLQNLGENYKLKTTKMARIQKEGMLYYREGDIENYKDGSNSKSRNAAIPSRLRCTLAAFDRGT